MSTNNEDIRESVKRMAHTLQKIEAVCIDALLTRPYKPGEAWQHFSEALAEVRKLCPEPFGNVADVKVLPIPNANDQLETGNIQQNVKKDWLEMPRGITLRRYVMGDRSVMFIGQYINQNGTSRPVRLYRVEVRKDETLGHWAVAIYDDGKLLWRGASTTNRAETEYVAVKALKAFLNCKVRHCEKTHRQSKEAK